MRLKPNWPSVTDSQMEAHLADGATTIQYGMQNAMKVSSTS